jgi:hypothetical protein
LYLLLVSDQRATLPRLALLTLLSVPREDDLGMVAVGPSMAL